MQTKHDTEIAAREAARKLGNAHVQIVESRHMPAEGRHNPATVYYVEGDDCSLMIRNWERLVYSGKGRAA